MHQITTREDLRRRVSGWKRAGELVALVPTMGNLHAGHLSLVDAAREAADRVVVSVFVNPTQFGAGEDYTTYPRTLDADRQLLEVRGVDLLFAPDVGTMYPEGTAKGARIQVPALEGMLCALSRPGHFSGVATVVAKLFNLVAPDRAYFGLKDYQQLLVIQHMVRDLSMPVEVIGVETVRAPDGLALSSRNGYLSPDDRARAPWLNKVLADAATALQQGERDFTALENTASKALIQAGLEPDYVAIRRPDDLLRPGVGEHAFIVLGAARLGGTRLIDNVTVTTAAG
ncbi:pantoate--beta-alanine ligase [Natronocella acetinitrilica]|jgi:pantoate--beta-alanine ligase|uniref:Pantothenate synthetase n=1 Tax=Natronocella acetinitrilica TaxID=414046 RepID=A0AAE3KB06_9GAMM|nr:pantoate--beta-alanine ligase [Natronocella acetinitrilica]MCP1675005.1 pantoate--beta-alanine ligase [Natronocella acetinitrilica]